MSCNKFQIPLTPFSLYRTRLQWMSSFRTAIEYADEAVRYQRSLVEKRKINRQDEKEKEDEEFNRIMTMNNDTLDHTKLQLEQEKQVRNIFIVFRLYIKERDGAISLWNWDFYFSFCNKRDPKISYSPPRGKTCA